MHLTELSHGIPGRLRFVELQRSAQFEPLNHLRQGVAFEDFRVNFADRGSDQVAGNRIATLELAFVFQLDLSGDGRQRGIQIEHTRHRSLFPVHKRAALRIGDHVFQHRDRQTLTHAGTFVDLLFIACTKRNLLHHFSNEVRHAHRDTLALGPRFLTSDLYSMRQLGGIVRSNLASDAILERRHDLPACGVVLWIGRERQQNIDRQTNRIALNLDVAFLHDVEQPDLDLTCQVGQLIDGEDASIGSRQQSVVDRQLVGDVLPFACRFDGIDIADHVGDGDVGRC